MLKINLGSNLALFFWATGEVLVKSEVMNFWTYLVIFKIFMWAGVLYFRAWHQNRSGILQGSTKYDYNEGLNLIWPLLPNFDQSNVPKYYTPYALKLFESGWVCRHSLILTRLNLLFYKYLTVEAVSRNGSNSKCKYCSLSHDFFLEGLSQRCFCKKLIIWF